MKVRQMFIATVAALSAAGFVATTGYAQQQPQGGGGQGSGNGQGAGRRRAGQQGQQRRMPLADAVKALNLPAEQQTKVDALIEKSRSDMRALPQEERRAKGREIQAKLLQDVNALLTPEQQTKLREEMRSQRQNGGNNNAGPFNGLVQQLNLTAEQKAKIDPIVKDATDQMAKARADQNLQGRDRSQKMRSIMDDTRNKIRPLLTPEQQTKLDSYRPGQGGGGNRPGGARRGGGSGNNTGGGNTGVGG